MSAKDEFLVGTAEQAKLARESAAKGGSGDSPPSIIRLGLVVEALSDSYVIAILGSDGVVCDTIKGVRAWGENTYDTGDQVFLAYIGDRPIPYILLSGGGGGGGISVGIANRFYSS